jgi:YgiT-type zinc finger domain-containing protein
MICPVCRRGETQPGTSTVTLERGGLTFAVKGVPAMVCANCGEEYVDSEATERVLCMAQEAAAGGLGSGVHEYFAESAAFDLEIPPRSAPRPAPDF